jgi:rubrerythrin
MRRLIAKHPERVVDYLAERLAFERSGVRLYDAVLERLREAEEPEARALQPLLQRQRDEEQEHVRWLQGQLETLGAGPHPMSARAQLSYEETRGLAHVILESTAPLPHLLHALLAAELVDHAGWDLLVALADEAKDGEAQRELHRRRDEEAQHLALCRELAERFALQQVLDEPLRLPQSP